MLGQGPIIGIPREAAAHLQTASPVVSFATPHPLAPAEKSQDEFQLWKQVAPSAAATSVSEPQGLPAAECDGQLPPVQRWQEWTWHDQRESQFLRHLTLDNA